MTTTGGRRAAGLLVAALAFATAPSALATSGTFSVPRVRGPAGGTVVVPVRAVVAAEVSSMQGMLGYDPSVLDVVEVTAGPALPSGGRPEFNADTRGWLKMGFVASPSKHFRGEGVVLQVRFRVKGTPGQESRLELANVRAWEPHDAEILVTTESGSVTVVEGGPGAILWIVLGGLLLLGLVVFFVVRRKRRRAPPAYEPQAGRTPEPAASRPSAGGAVGKFCTSCGARVAAAGQRFCAHCGAALA